MASTRPPQQPPHDRSRWRLPDGFAFGVSDSGFQSEGGYNAAGQPTNNWATWERDGRARRSGDANEFWTRYDEHFDRAAEAGCDTYRLGVEWTRCEPHEGRVDERALDHYEAIVRSCVDHGLEPVIALHHFTHPAWLGEDFWLDPTAPERFAQWVDLIHARLAPHCSRWVTINEPNACAIGSYFIGYFPPGRTFHAGATGMALDHMLTAHVLSYEVIHDRQPEAQVGFSTYVFSNYDVDGLLTDVLRGRSRGIDRAGLPKWLAERRRGYHAEVQSCVPRPRAATQAAMNVTLRGLLGIENALTRTVEAVYASTYEQCIDVTQVSFYDPDLSRYVRVPGRLTTGLRGVERSWRPDPKHWEQAPSPEQLTAYLRARFEPGEPIWILENGLCNAVLEDTALPRADGWDRPTYLRHNIAAVIDALDAGLDIASYFCWTLFDNYQWGESDSCFGLYGVNRENGVKFLDVDSMGNDSGGALRTIIDGVRTGDLSVLASPTAAQAATSVMAHRDELDVEWTGTEAAFFDLDKTVIDRAAMVAFGKPLLDAGLITRRMVALSVYRNVVFGHFGADAQRMAKLKAYAMDVVRGWDHAELTALIVDNLDTAIRPIVFDQALALIHAHKAAGRRVFLVSASPTEIVRPVADMLGIDEVIASRVVVGDDGRYTGEVELWNHGPAKPQAMLDAAETWGLDLSGSFAYSDSATDLPMLETVGHPVAVNPDKALATIARERGWPMMKFVANPKTAAKAAKRARR
jgi:HAD superfamily hydrolase (TIGR01490 family)